jgi:hypothetical protein
MQSESKERRGGAVQHRLLLAAACGGMLAAPAARAAIVNEATDFSNTGASPTVLPAGTYGVNGHVDYPEDQDDYFRFAGLDGNYGSLSIGYNMTPDGVRGGEYSLDLVFLNSALGQIGFAHFSQLGPLNGSVNVTVPNDGVIIGRVVQNYADANDGTSYAVSFDPAAVPEPGTAAMIGLSAAALLARRRRRPPQAE